MAAAGPSAAPPELSPAEMMKASLYDVLGLPKTASQDDIKRGYRRMALKYRVYWTEVCGGTKRES